MLKKGLFNLLTSDVRQWNEWREKHPNREVDLSEVNLRGTELSEANLSRVNFCSADLSGTVLRDANCREANFIWANLSEANLNHANLAGADFYRTNLFGAKLNRANCSQARFVEAELSRANLSQADLTRADLSEANLNESVLIQANLSEVDLNHANLGRANLVEANLNRANLCQANLKRAELNQTNLSRANLKEACLIEICLKEASLWRATLTGACIENWKINQHTNFEEVICQYIYLQRNKQERYPFRRDFQPGELSQFIRQIDCFVNLTFSDGIDWQAFLQCFGELQSKYGEPNLSIQAFEKKDSDIFVVRLKILNSSSQTVVATEFLQLYNRVLQNSRLQEQKELEVKTTKDKSKGTDLLELARLAAYSPNT